jgi:hypothetical protein
MTSSRYRPEPPTIQSIDGRDIYNAFICNPDYHRRYLEDHGNFIGTSGDSYMHSFLLRAINIPGITPTFWVHESGYYDPGRGVWRASTKEIRRGPKNQKIDPRLGWNKVPWSNWHVNPLPGNWSGRIRFLQPSRADVVWSTGLPQGYILRADVSTEVFPKVD